MSIRKYASEDYVIDNLDWEKLQNKPFYEMEAVEYIYIPETTVSNFGEYDYYGTYYMSITPVDYYITFDLNKTYTVIWDGVRYDNVTCQDTLGDATLGSTNRQFAGAYGEHNEYPFGITMQNMNETPELVIMTDNTLSHTVKVMDIISEAYIKTLDPKYLPKELEATALILSSPNGTRFEITVGDDGVLTAIEMTIE